MGSQNVPLFGRHRFQNSLLARLHVKGIISHATASPDNDGTISVKMCLNTPSCDLATAVQLAAGTSQGSSGKPPTLAQATRTHRPACLEHLIHSFQSFLNEVFPQHVTDTAH